MRTFYAECILCKRRYEAEPSITVCKCGGILDIKYQYHSIDALKFKYDICKSKEKGLWKYSSLLPVDQAFVNYNLLIGNTPQYNSKVLAKDLGVKAVLVKDDSRNPTSSLKDRASALAIVKAVESRNCIVACASTGNAASSLAGNAAANGLKSVIFVPERIPMGKLNQLLIYGAEVIVVKGSYAKAFEVSEHMINQNSWYNRNAAINPFLIEGKKTVAFEICEQYNWEKIDFVSVPVGDGCTIASIWKGFKELNTIGVIDYLPRIISVQAKGCAPINRAFRANSTEIENCSDNTIADSIAVGSPRNYIKAINAIKESNGIVVDVSDELIYDAMRYLGEKCGIFAEPAAAVSFAGLFKLKRKKLFGANCTIATIVTGSGLKDPVNAQVAATKKPYFIDTIEDIANLDVCI